MFIFSLLNCMFVCFGHFLNAVFTFCLNDLQEALYLQTIDDFSVMYVANLAPRV